MSPPPVSAQAVRKRLKHRREVFAPSGVPTVSDEVGPRSGESITTRALTSVSGVSSAVEVSTRGPNTCVLLGDGTVWCWGLFNTFGELGDGTTTTRSAPTTVQWPRGRASRAARSALNRREGSGSLRGEVATASDEFNLAGQRLEGRYDVERVVAAGGFGVVYFARHRALKSPVAVKVLRMPTDLSAAEQKDFAQRFLAEAQTLASLLHPAVVRAVDFGVADMPDGKTAPWTALEWVEGQTLKEFFDARRGQPMSPREALALLKPVFEALAAAHALGIAHRDVKPANIMLPKEGITSRILDFGIAKTMEPGESTTTTGETATRSQLTSFSIKYAAPEQVGGMRTGPWTDVHALALVLTEALVGEAPLAGGDYVEIAANVLQAERPTPLRFGFDAGPWEEVLSRALSMKSSTRFKDAKDFLDALERSVPGELRAVASTRPPTAPENTSHNASTLRPSLVNTAPAAAARPRSPLVIALAVVAAIALVGALVALTSRHTGATTSPGGAAPPRGASAAVGEHVAPTEIVLPTTPAMAAQPAQPVAPVAPSTQVVDAGAPVNTEAVHHRDGGRHRDGRVRNPPSNPVVGDPQVPPV